MPGDLKSPEQSVPYHYDTKYELGSNPFEPGSDDLRRYLQSVVMEKNIVLEPDRMTNLVMYLNNKGFLCRNHGDESFRNEVFKYIDKIKKAQKVAKNWQTLTA